MAWYPIYGRPGNSIVGGKNVNAEIVPDGPIVPAQSGTPSIIAQVDDFDTNQEVSFTFLAPLDGLYQVNIYLQPKSSAGFSGDVIQTYITYVADEGVPYVAPGPSANPGGAIIPSSLPLYCALDTQIVVSSAFTTFGTPGVVPADVSSCSGVINSGMFISGEIVYQGASYAGRTAAAIFAGIYQTTTFTAYGISGTPDGSDWKGHVSGADWGSTSVLTLNTNPFYGGGEEVIQTGTGATATLINDPTGSSGMYVNGIVGTPNATGVWIGQSNGDAFVPSGAPTKDIFPYHMSLRILLLPNSYAGS